MAGRQFVIAVFACSLFLVTPPASAQADLALVLAIDVSSSVDRDRFKLQREGIAAGSESRDVLVAVSNGLHQTIEIAVVEWSEDQSVLVGWTVIRGDEDLDRLSEVLRTAPRPEVGFKTDAGGAIKEATALMDPPPLAADRKVIDVSGDGKQNAGTLRADKARDSALARGITINGLPITSGEEPEVDRLYKTHVIGGENVLSGGGHPPRHLLRCDAPEVCPGNLGLGARDRARRSSNGTPVALLSL